MKSSIFLNAIRNRNKVKLLYKLNEIIVEPYYISRNREGKKVIYGRINNSNSVQMFEYDKMFNIRTLNKFKFYPIIPIIPNYNWNERFYDGKYE